MDITITPGKLSGTVQAIPSKSQAHRLLICAAFADRDTKLHCPQTNQDIEATADCLRALGAVIRRTPEGYLVVPVSAVPQKATLPCRESGSTLRFMLPITGALGVDAVFTLSGRLPERPLSPLWEEMERMGCSLSRPSGNTISCKGKLRPGVYSIRGNISSQFITGLLFAMALMPDESQLLIEGVLESQPYVTMTQLALKTFGISTAGYIASGQYPFRSPGEVAVEGDWSNAAFFLCAQALGSPLQIEGLRKDSPQGDRAILDLCSKLSENCSVSAKDIPDLIPVLSVLAAANKGAIFTDIQRLRMKESDRVASVAAMISALGGTAKYTDSELTIYGTGLKGGTVDSQNDHRIAMSAAIAATVAKQPVTILGAQCVAKSYPTFWEEYQRLGGQYEQYIR